MTQPNSTECTCPYEWGGWRQHIVATLLTYITDAMLVAERLPLANPLAPLTRDQLQATLFHFVAGDADLADVIELYVADFTTTLASVPMAGAADGAGGPKAS